MARRWFVAGVAALLALSLAPLATAQEAADPCDDPARDPALDSEDLCGLADDLGLLDAFDDNAELVLVAAAGVLGLVVLWFLLALVVNAWPRRWIRVSAEARVAEVDPGEAARFTVTVENRLRRKPVGVVVMTGEPPAGWSTAVSVERAAPSGFLEVFRGGESGVTLGGRASGKNVLHALVEVTVSPTATQEEWSELEVRAVPYRRGRPKPRKGKGVKVITLLREHAAKVAIADVRHEPAEFTPGTVVTSAVSLTNKGNEPARTVPVTFALDDLELETKTLALPAGETREVAFRWTAHAGPNQVRVRLGEVEMEEAASAPAAEATASE